MACGGVVDAAICQACVRLSLPMTSRPRILQVRDGRKDTTASIYFVLDMFITDLIQGRSDSVCGVTVVDFPDEGLWAACGGSVWRQRVCVQARHDVHVNQSLAGMSAKFGLLMGRLTGIKI